MANPFDNMIARELSPSLFNFQQCFVPESIQTTLEQEQLSPNSNSAACQYETYSLIKLTSNSLSAFVETNSLGEQDSFPASGHTFNALVRIIPWTRKPLLLSKEHTTDEQIIDITEKTVMICDLRVRQLIIDSNSKQISSKISQQTVESIETVDIIIARGLEEIGKEVSSPCSWNILELQHQIPDPIISLKVIGISTFDSSIIEKGSTSWHLLNNKIHDILSTYNLHIKPNTLINLRNCPLASLNQSSPSIDFIFIQAIEFKEQSKLNDNLIGRVNSRTKVTIEKIHSIDYYSRIGKVIQTNNRISNCVIQSLSGPYKILQDLIKIRFKLKRNMMSMMSGGKSGNNDSEIVCSMKGLDEGGIGQIRCNMATRLDKSGILLTGLSGCGKTLLVRELCKQLAVKLLEFDLSREIITNSNSIGLDYETLCKKLTSIFNEATESNTPTVLLLEQIHVFESKPLGSGNRSANNKKKKLVNYLCTLLDDISKRESSLVIICTTDRIHQVPDKLKMFGRLDKELHVGLPNENDRQVILKYLTEGIQEFKDIDLYGLAKELPGFTGADIAKFIHIVRVKCYEEKTTRITDQHIRFALSRVIPTVLNQQSSDSYIVNGDVHRQVGHSLDHISGMDSVKFSLIKAIVWPIQFPQAFLKMGILPPKGVLLYGPPGCGKTTLVRAIANDHHTNFISVTGAELFASGVGDSEKIISQLFHRARIASPCVLFIDELESVVGSRSLNSSSKSINEGILSMLLIEMDGIGLAKSTLVSNNPYEQSPQYPRLVVVGATNRPDLIDSALLRPGRFDRIVPVSPPNAKDRILLLKKCSAAINLSSDSDVDFEKLGAETERFSNADIVNLHREAALLALADDINCTKVTMNHYEKAKSLLSPSLTTEYLKSFSDYLLKSATKVVNDDNL